VTATVIPRRGSPRMGSLTSVTFQRYRYFSVASGTRDGPLPHHVTNTPAEPHLAHGESSLIVRAIQKDSVVLKYSSRGKTYVPYRRQFRVRERPPCRRESRYLRHQGRCLGDNRQACLSGHEGGSRHAWRRGAAWSAPRPWAAPDCEGCRGPVQDGGSSWPVPVYHFRCDVGRGDLPESNPAPPGPNGAIVPAGGLGTGAAGTGCARFPRLRRPPRLAAFFEAN
jgi:hypothetical protein